MSSDIIIHGATKVLANIRKMADEIEKSNIKAVSKAAMEVERLAKRNQTPHVDTGRLRASIGAEKKTDKSIFVGVHKVAPTSGEGFEAGSNVEYAEAHEYRYPFLGPAVETVRQKYPDIIKGEIKFR